MDKDNNNYARHILGIVSLFSWLNEHDKNQGFVIKKNSIYFPLSLSKRFSLGIPKRNNSPVFLAVQDHELSWISEIFWDRVIVQCYPAGLHFISKKITHDELPCIPSFSIFIPFDHPEKPTLIYEMKKIEVRGYWKDREDNIRVEGGIPRCSLPLKKWSGFIFKDHELEKEISFEDLVREKINLTSNKGLKFVV